jgi:DNA repair exonuclease SbcCD ATPase subunit
MAATAWVPKIDDGWAGPDGSEKSAAIVVEAIEWLKIACSQNTAGWDPKKKICGSGGGIMANMEGPVSKLIALLIVQCREKVVAVERRRGGGAAVAASPPLPPSPSDEEMVTQRKYLKLEGEQRQVQGLYDSLREQFAALEDENSTLKRTNAKLIQAQSEGGDESVAIKGLRDQLTAAAGTHARQSEVIKDLEAKLAVVRGERDTCNEDKQEAVKALQRAQAEVSNLTGQLRQSPGGAAEAQEGDERIDISDQVTRLLEQADKIQKSLDLVSEQLRDSSARSGAAVAAPPAAHREAVQELQGALASSCKNHAKMMRGMKTVVRDKFGAVIAVVGLAMKHIDNIRQYQSEAKAIHAEWLPKWDAIWEDIQERVVAHCRADRSS